MMSIISILFQANYQFNPLFPLVGAECSSSLVTICIAELVIQCRAWFMLINSNHAAGSHCIVPTKSIRMLLRIA